jgi:error-prone DNA polymerase
LCGQAPIVGKAVNPYWQRRQGREPVTYDHPSLKPALEETLGVILFQERVFQVTMVRRWRVPPPRRVYD